MNYTETIDYLYQTAPMFQNIGGGAYKEGLETTCALNELLDHPHRSFKTIHIGGTNGKGSVSQMIYSVLKSAGYRVGLYTSPHLKDFRERMRVNDEMIPEQDVIDFIETMRPRIEELKPSFFEITTVMAFDFFRRREVDIAVIEVGMGGRLDCTNVIRPVVSVITNISPDHTQFLGRTKREIAREKAGIIKEGVPAVIGEFDLETAPVFIAKAKEADAPFRFADQCYRFISREKNHFTIEDLHEGNLLEIQLGMEGNYQGKNLCTALSALDILAGPLKLNEDTVRKGLAEATVPGRWQTLATEPCRIIVDTGHNEAGLTFVTEQLASEKYHKLYFILGMVGDKAIDRILPILPKNAHYIFTSPGIPRALEAEKLAEQAAKSGLEGEIIPSVKAALEHAKKLAGKNDLIFVGGSTFTVAEVL